MRGSMELAGVVARTPDGPDGLNPRGRIPRARDGRRRRAHGAPWLLALALAFLFGTSACSSGGTKSETTARGPVELRYRALAKNLSFGIVNASHTDRTDLYSKRQPIDQATTKVSPDEVVDAIVDYFRDQGFFEIALTGKSPATPPQGATQILEVTLPDGAYHAVLRSGVSAEHATRFQTCAKALLDVYNNTLQLQAVEEAPLWGGSAPRQRDGTSRTGG